MELTREDITIAMNEAYDNAGHNAYFGNGFKAGVDFVLEKIQEDKKVKLCK